jgi:phage baseplate assembly protein W
MMNDLYQYFGDDLNPSATGDLQPVVTTTRGQQRILRRLLTNPGDYIWHPDYGAGLPRYVGSVINVRQMKALIRGQVLLEDSVAKTPEPVIDVQAISGGMTVAIQYNDADTNTPQSLSFNVNK